MDENCIGITFELTGTTDIDEMKLNSIILLISELRKNEVHNEIDVKNRNRTINDAIKILETMKIDEY